MCRFLSYFPSTNFSVVPVFPALEYPLVAARIPVPPKHVVKRIARTTSATIFSERTRIFFGFEDSIFSSPEGETIFLTKVGRIKNPPLPKTA
ncbi:Uncharacterised protein [Chlamydia trachomatis]|nr:Uncharacterised protein [Chlamydia trachomatis]